MIGVMLRQLLLIMLNLTVVSIILIGIIGNVVGPNSFLNQWEKHNVYPFGRMCNSIFTGYVDTCR
jgi:hypothetical protein